MLIDDQQDFMIQLGQKENPILVLRQPTSDELRTFLSSRFKRKGTAGDSLMEARLKFVDELLVGCKQIEVKEAGNVVPLTPELPNWKGRIPANWKTSVALHFEEKEAFTPEDEKN